MTGRIIEMPEALVERGKTTLNYKEALQEIIRIITIEYANKNIEALQVWKDVEEELKSKGIVLSENEIISFNFKESVFIIKDKDVK